MSIKSDIEGPCYLPVCDLLMGEWMKGCNGGERWGHKTEECWAELERVIFQRLLSVPCCFQRARPQTAAKFLAMKPMSGKEGHLK